MDLRHTHKGRKVLAAVAITTGLVLTVAGCGGGGDGKSKADSSASSSTASKEDGSDQKSSQTPSTDKVLATAKDGDITVTITSAVRDPGGFVTVSGNVRNDGAKSWLGANWVSDERELRKNGGSLAGASLVDTEGKKKYLILRDTSGRCLCTKFSGQISPGSTAEWYAQFPAPPEGSTKVDFQVGSMPPASIEISEGE
ncbi:hypothetical protein GCM10011579_069510 [Streptomyces albiflavescens]|uniref:Lipoprotein n=1 Tax=Streptomyces albiflavescens TaxID=1623582 RepID=A0A917YA85_9ACTN|nr:hypothetical protein [Streptomyces albiflavescens]GGN82158.1 hypothetical protein GCM10011579_069510 [Streptomyces albiflavescens]